MDNSILDSIKKLLGIDAENTQFDTDILLLINGVFATLKQLGVGPPDGYQITGKEDQWVTFTGDGVRGIELNMVVTYVSLKVKLDFDPPESSFHTTAVKERIAELEARLIIDREHYSWVDPTPPIVLEI